ncbi:hypothetical protein [Bradyrhizobium cenepequi]
MKVHCSPALERAAVLACLTGTAIALLGLIMPLWPTKPEIELAALSSPSVHTQCFDVTNRSLLFPVGNLVITCRPNTAAAPGSLIKDACPAMKRARLSPRETVHICPAPTEFPPEATVADLMVVSAEYDSSIPGKTRIADETLFKLDATASPPRWLPGKRRLPI